MCGKRPHGKGIRLVLISQYNFKWDPGFAIPLRGIVAADHLQLEIPFVCWDFFEEGSTLWTVVTKSPA